MAFSAIDHKGKDVNGKDLEDLFRYFGYHYTFTRKGNTLEYKVKSDVQAPAEPVLNNLLVTCKWFCTKFKNASHPWCKSESNKKLMNVK